MEWYMEWVRDNALLSAAVQFGILGTLGEVVSHLVKTRRIEMPFGIVTLVLKMAAWALLALYGLGCGLFVSPNTSALMGAADPKTQGSAGAMLAMARTGGMFIGVGLGTGVYSAAGGVDHGRWSAPDLHAFSVAMGVAAALMLAAAVVSVFRGEPER